MKRLFLIALLVCPAALADVTATRETLRAQALTLINRDRAAAGLPRLELDPAASRLADEYCEVQIRLGTTGHFTTDGLAPYMRYSFAGGNDGILENAAGWSRRTPFGERGLYELVHRSHQAMMAERPPADGHRRAILDEHATHAGIGLAWAGGEFRLVHLLIRRWLAWESPFPRFARVGDAVTGSARAIEGAAVEAISVHHEPLPRSLTPAAASARDEYNLPPRRRDYLPRASSEVEAIARGAAAAQRNGFALRADGSFSFTVPLTDGPGIYTVVVWVRTGEAAVAASNVSIRVEPAAAGSGFSAAGR